MHANLPLTFSTITWGPFQNVNLLYFLLKIQISNGCNVLNIAGNPIKDIIVNLSFLSSGSKVMQNIPCLSWVSGGNFGKSTFSCTVQLCMQICHKPFPNHMRAIFKMLIYSIFYWKYRFQMAVIVLNIAGNPIKDIIVNLSFLCSGSKVVQNIPCPAGYLVEIWKIYFFMYCPIMHANLPLTFSPSHEGHFKMLIYSIFYWKYRFQMAVMCLILQETP